MEKQLLKPSTSFKKAATAVGMLAGATALAVLPDKPNKPKELVARVIWYRAGGSSSNDPRIPMIESLYSKGKTNLTKLDYDLTWADHSCWNQVP